MLENCQCDAGYHGGWYKVAMKNHPCWRCRNCGAFSGKMEGGDIIRFKMNYFDVPRGKKRIEAMKRFRPIVSKPKVVVVRLKNTTGTQLSLF